MATQSLRQRKAYGLMKSMPPNTPQSPYGQPPQDPQPGYGPQPPQYGPQSPQVIPPQTVYPQPPAQPVANFPQAVNQPPHQPNYEFIMNANQPSARPVSLPGSNSTLKRVLVVLASIIVLIILANLIKGVFSGSKVDVPVFLSVAQDQQELIHLTSNATQQSGTGQAANLSTDDQNFAVTTLASITSSQSQLITYLKNNGTKVKAKQLDLKINKSLDSQLTTAQSNNTYDQTFDQILSSQLTTYKRDLAQVYSHTTGPKGRQLLSQEYKDAALLQTQLSSPTS